jgi:hypothetical protein
MVLILSACAPATVPTPDVLATATPEVVETIRNPGESWSRLVDELKAAEGRTTENKTDQALQHLATARAIYAGVFQESAARLDPDTEALIRQAYDDAQAAVRAGDAQAVNLSRQRTDKSLYKVAFMNIEAALNQGDVETAAWWFTVMDQKFKFDEQPSAASVFMAELERKPEELERLRPLILDELLGLFTLKVKEEVVETVEALEAGDIATAAEKAMAGLMYYRVIQPGVQAKLVAEQEGQLFHELEELFKHAQEGNLEKVQSEAEEVAALLAAYQGLDDLAAVVKEISDMLRLVEVEYVDAVKAEGGEITHAGEYKETEIFLARAVETLEANQAALEAASPEATLTLAANLTEIGDLVKNLGRPAEVTALVAESQGLLEGLDKAQVVLSVESTEVKSGEEVMVVMTVTDVPAAGLGAFDVDLSFDPQVLQATAVSFEYGNGIETIDNQGGTVRLAGFKARNPAQGEIVIAAVTFRAVGTAGTQTEIGVTGRELADIAGINFAIAEERGGTILIK